MSSSVFVGNVEIGGNAPVVVQSMTNTDTADARATAKQIQSLAAAGSELVRITVNNDQSAKQVSKENNSEVVNSAEEAINNEKENSKIYIQQFTSKLQRTPHL